MCQFRKTSKSFDKLDLAVDSFLLRMEFSVLAIQKNYIMRGNIIPRVNVHIP